MKNLAQPSPSPRLGGVCVTLSAVALVLFRSVSNAQQNEPRNVSVCQLVDSPKEFNGKYVRVRAQVSSDGIERTNLKDDACRKGVALWIPQDVRKDPDVSKLEDALYRRGSPGTMGKKIDGTFEGRFEWRPKERTASRPVETGRAGCGRPEGGELRWPVPDDRRDGFGFTIRRGRFGNRKSPCRRTSNTRSSAVPRR